MSTLISIKGTLRPLSVFLKHAVSKYNRVIYHLLERYDWPQCPGANMILHFKTVSIWNREKLILNLLLKKTEWKKKLKLKFKIGLFKKDINIGVVFKMPRCIKMIEEFMRRKTLIVFLQKSWFLEKEKPRKIKFSFQKD